MEVPFLTHSDLGPGQGRIYLTGTAQRVLATRAGGTCESILQVVINTDVLNLLHVELFSSAFGEREDQHFKKLTNLTNRKEKKKLD